MDDIFSVISDSTRRNILDTLHRAGTKELSVSELVETLGISQPTVSKHLKILRDSELVDVRLDGQHRFYSLNAKALKPVEKWLSTINPQKPKTQDAPKPSAKSKTPKAAPTEPSLGETASIIADALGRAWATTNHVTKTVIDTTKEGVELAVNQTQETAKKFGVRVQKSASHAKCWVEEQVDRVEDWAEDKAKKYFD
ncbi:MAG: winged helix-turn-helix transcriptional regulator [Microbacteriaceae bacterium]|nr:winged helix-turn-helix transcriptional regulator [Microbacteriaceae bacterium]